MTLEQLEPKEVFHYFKEICKIPHGSGNTKQISDYLVQEMYSRLAIIVLILQNSTD